MAKRALGLIEVRGYLGAVVAADVAVKAANVSLLNIEKIKSGLNTVQITGDVGAVKAAVAAAVAELQDKPFYRGSHVIASMDEQTEGLIKARKVKEPPLDQEEHSLLPDFTIVKEMTEIIPDSVASGQPNEEEGVSGEKEAPVKEGSSEEQVDRTELTAGADKEKQSVQAEEESASTSLPKFSRTELEKLKVVKLRSLAYREKEIALSKKEIKFANKKQLVQALMELARKE